MGIPKSRRVWARVTNHTGEALARRAEEDGISLSDVVRDVLNAWAISRGKGEESARVTEKFLTGWARKMTQGRVTAEDVELLIGTARREAVAELALERQQRAKQEKIFLAEGMDQG